MQTQALAPVDTSVGCGSRGATVANPVIHIEGDGSIVALTDTRSSDAGSAAAVASVIAEELRISIDRIRVQSVDVLTAMAGQQPLRSRVSLRSTAVAIRAYLLDQASSYFDMDASELLLNDGRVITFDGRAIAYADLSRAGTGESLSPSHRSSNPYIAVRLEASI